MLGDLIPTFGVLVKFGLVLVNTCRLKIKAQKNLMVTVGIEYSSLLNSFFIIIGKPKV